MRKSPDYREYGPAYQEYAPDMLANRRFKMMSLKERGLFYTMRLECWQNGNLPFDIEKLAACIGQSSERVREALTDNVMSFFKLEDDILIATDLEKYRQEQLKRHQAQSMAGKKTNEKKRLQKANAEHSAERSAQHAVERTLLRGDELRGVELKGEELSGRDISDFLNDEAKAFVAEMDAYNSENDF